MRSRRTIGLLLLAFGCSTAQEVRIGGALGAGWFTAPTVSRQAESLRPTFVSVLDGWWDRGPVSIGAELTNDLSYASQSPAGGLADDETLVLSSGILAVGKSIVLSDFPAMVRLGLGGGVVHVWDRLDRGTQQFQQESWGPEFHLTSLWEREWGEHGRVLVRLAGIYSSTFRSDIQGAALRAKCDWSRVEFSMGWGWRS